uniref:Uncharacterized protein n=1 Tax=Alexandrium andersonii TaxID=327968 RepID=A0A7S2AFI1_9DINO
MYAAGAERRRTCGAPHPARPGGGGSALLFLLLGVLALARLLDHQLAPRGDGVLVALGDLYAGHVVALVGKRRPPHPRPILAHAVGHPERLVLLLGRALRHVGRHGSRARGGEGRTGLEALEQPRNA